MLDQKSTRVLLERLIDVVVTREVVSREAAKLAGDIEIMEVRLNALDEQNERLVDEQLALEKNLEHLGAVYPFVMRHLGYQYAINPKLNEIEVYPIPAQDITQAFAVLYEKL
jgi:hypothetical protein